MSNIYYTSPAVAKHHKRKGSVYLSGTQVFAQKRRTNSRDPKTTDQQTNRSCVEWISRSFATLDPGDKALWYNPGIDGYFGFYAFMHYNLPRCAIGLPFVTVPPVSPPVVADGRLYSYFHSINKNFRNLSSPQCNLIDIYFRTS